MKRRTRLICICLIVLMFMLSASAYAAELAVDNGYMIGGFGLSAILSSLAIYILDLGIRLLNLIDGGLRVVQTGNWYDVPVFGSVYSVMVQAGMRTDVLNHISSINGTENFLMNPLCDLSHKMVGFSRNILVIVQENIRNGYITNFFASIASQMDAEMTGLPFYEAFKTIVHGFFLSEDGNVKTEVNTFMYNFLKDVPKIH